MDDSELEGKDRPASTTTRRTFASTPPPTHPREAALPTPRPSSNPALTHPSLLLFYLLCLALPSPSRFSLGSSLQESFWHWQHPVIESILCCLSVCIHAVLLFSLNIHSFSFKFSFALALSYSGCFAYFLISVPKHSNQARQSGQSLCNDSCQRRTPTVDVEARVTEGCQTE